MLSLTFDVTLVPSQSVRTHWPMFVSPSHCSKLLIAFASLSLPLVCRCFCAGLDVVATCLLVVVVVLVVMSCVTLFVVDCLRARSYSAHIDLPLRPRSREELPGLGVLPPKLLHGAPRHCFDEGDHRCVAQRSQHELARGMVGAVFVRWWHSNTNATTSTSIAMLRLPG